MKITTKKGDGGRTELLFGEKVGKTSPQILALGSVDELNAFLGYARVLSHEEHIDRLQQLLVTLMGELAMPEGGQKKYDNAGFGRIGPKEIDWLEEEINKAEAQGTHRGWLRPGADGKELQARLHLARTVARRAELSVWELPEEIASPNLKIFMNRISDWIWLLARSLD